MAISTLIILVGVPTASVIYSGAKVITVNFQGQALFGLDLGSITVGCWIIGCLAAIYVFAGGLKACAWADLIQGTALIVGGAIIAYLAMRLLGSSDPAALAATATSSVDPSQLADAGAIERLQLLNAGDWQAGKLHMVRPPDDPEVPWTALVVGLWIPNFFYWGLNQYITQRTLGSKSLAEGQRGVVFAAFLKLLIPFVVVIPGILAFNLFTADLETAAVVKNAKRQPRWSRTPRPSPPSRRISTRSFRTRSSPIQRNRSSPTTSRPSTSASKRRGRTRRPTSRSFASPRPSPSATLSMPTAF
jgi:SSS family solute:Na+ symporter